MKLIYRIRKNLKPKGIKIKVLYYKNLILKLYNMKTDKMMKFQEIKVLIQLKKIEVFIIKKPLIKEIITIKIQQFFLTIKHKIQHNNMIIIKPQVFPYIT